MSFVLVKQCSTVLPFAVPLQEVLSLEQNNFEKCVSTIAAPFRKLLVLQNCKVSIMFRSFNNFECQLNLVLAIHFKTVSSTVQLGIIAVMR